MRPITPLRALLVAAFAFGAADAAAQQTGRLVYDTIHAKTLERNVYGDSPNRSVLVYLPPSYDAQTARRYPTIYLLHGFGGTETSWLRAYGGFHIQRAMDSLVAAGTVREMIIVMPNARNRFDGSFYLNSASAGNWEDLIARELVTWIDGKYRTIARPESRGLAGHSMGGFGTFVVGARHAGSVFSALYAMSGCCTRMVGSSSVTGWTPITAIDSLSQVSRLTFGQRVTVALSAGYAANPSRPPLFFDPVVDVRAGATAPDTAVQSKWRRNVPMALVAPNADKLKSLRGFVFDVGTSDNLVSVADLAAMDSAFTANGVRHTFETYDGDHSNRIGVRMIARVLPFFSSTLVFQ